jgi:hypothetical protein
MILPTSLIERKSKASRFKTPLKLKVLASQHGYGFVFRKLTGELIDSHVGLLPADHQFNKQTAELYALCEAAKRLAQEDLADFRVALVCSSLPLAGTAERRQRAA